MEKPLIIGSNPLRLLGQTFLAILPISGNAPLKDGTTANCVSTDYGNLGQVKLVHSFNKPLYDISETVFLSVDGPSGSGVEGLKAKGHFGTDTFQICCFKFLSRKSAAFQTLLDKELPKAGIQLTHQASLL